MDTPTESSNRDPASLAGRTLFITGASRGIGEAIALRAARDGANVAVAAKTSRPHRVLPGTIHTVAARVEELGGHALPLVVDVRDEAQIQAAVERTVEHFGGIDVLVNNASAISLTGTRDTPMRRFDLMFSVNVRATFACSQACLPHLIAADQPHILTLGPPLNLDPRWFAPHVAYTISKYGMSLCTLGMAEEFRAEGIAVNALWPKTVIATAALRMLPDSLPLADRSPRVGDDTATIDPRHCRKPDIVADAAHAILTRPSRERTGAFLIDEDVLRESGLSDFSDYQVEPGAELYPDLFV